MKVMARRASERGGTKQRHHMRSESHMFMFRHWARMNDILTHVVPGEDEDEGEGEYIT